MTLSVSAADCVVGAADGFTDEAGQQLEVNETGGARNLQVKNVSGCLGSQIANGDLTDLTATLAITTRGAVNVF